MKNNILWSFSFQVPIIEYHTKLQRIANIYFKMKRDLSINDHRYYKTLDGICCPQQIFAGDDY